MANREELKAQKAKGLKAAKLCIDELEGHAIRKEVTRRGIDLNDCPGKAKRVREDDDLLEEGKQTVSDLYVELENLNRKVRFEEDQVKKLEEDRRLKLARIEFEGEATCGTDEKDLLKTARAHLLTHSARSTEHDMKCAMAMVTEGTLENWEDGELRELAEGLGKRSFDDDTQEMVIKMPRIE